MALMARYVDEGVEPRGPFDFLKAFRVDFDAIEKIVPHPGQKPGAQLHQSGAVIGRDFVQVFIRLFANLPYLHAAGSRPTLHEGFQPGMMQDDVLEFQVAFERRAHYGPLDFVNGIDQSAMESKSCLRLSERFSGDSGTIS